MAPEHSGYIEEYPLIRVDKFTETVSKLPDWLSESAKEDLPPFSTSYPSPHIQLLSHPHTDHLVGLSSLSQNSAPIYCSETTKRLLLALERKEDRIRFDQKKITTRKRPYRHLRRTEQECKTLFHQTGIQALTPWDLLIPLPFDKPIQIQYNAKIKIRLTLLPANHMPGSTMFLIEGSRGAVLHTGDLRAEQNFIQDLIAKSHLGRLSILPSPFLNSPALSSPNVNSCGSPSKLESVYLDTERIMDSQEPLLRSKAINDILQIIKLYPKSTSFHIDLWTSGYEEFCIGLQKTFSGEQDEDLIHIDRYKAELFEIISKGGAEFASLTKIVHQEKEKCGRFCISDNADCMQQEGVIRIKPYESISVKEWQEKRKEIIEQIKQARKGNCQFPTELPLPIQRHSPLPELYRMIACLKPRNLIANTATYTARFISARMSESIGLSGACEAEKRQRNSARKPNADAEEEERKWQELDKIWKSTEIDDSTFIHHHQSKEQTQAEAFFDHVSRFRTILYGQKKMESERLLLECLDAANEEFPIEPLPSASASVLCPSSSSRDNILQNTLTSTKAKIWEAPGKYASVNASPFMTAAMREAGCSSNASVQQPLNDQSKSNTPILTTELASRYLAYAAMYLGWKIRNPSRYRQEMAWRAIRKVKPELAKQTEEALQKELGWSIPPWDEVTTTMSLQPNTTTTNTVLQLPQTPSTPCPLPSHNLAQSISPLELGKSAKALQSQLDREAESQQSLFSNDNEIEQRDENDQGPEVIQLERLKSPPCAQRYHKAQHTTRLTLSQLRETVQCLRTGNILPSFRAIGQSCFESIINEWLDGDKVHQSFSHKSRSRSTSIDNERMRCQLDLIGVAAKSQRARRLLGWERVDFNKAHYALIAVFEEQTNTNNTSSSPFMTIPHANRAKIVLRYLQPHLT